MRLWRTRARGPTGAPARVVLVRLPAFLTMGCMWLCGAMHMHIAQPQPPLHFLHKFPPFSSPFTTLCQPPAAGFAFAAMATEQRSISTELAKTTVNALHFAQVDALAVAASFVPGWLTCAVLVARVASVMRMRCWPPCRMCSHRMACNVPCRVRSADETTVTGGTPCPSDCACRWTRCTRQRVRCCAALLLTCCCAQRARGQSAVATAATAVATAATAAAPLASATPAAAPDASRCRKHRRRSSQLLQSVRSSSKEFQWLETHLWHVKRMRMRNLWGYRVATAPNDKSVAATVKVRVCKAVRLRACWHSCHHRALHSVHSSRAWCMMPRT